MRTGVANLPLHYGSCPPWLFGRMKKLSREITIFIVENFGAEKFLENISHPYWFTSFGCVLGFDWHSSGLTTTVLGALKEGLKGLEKDLGIFVCGGKGATSRKTPEEIDKNQWLNGQMAKLLIYASKMAAKVDNTALQDGYQLYHHNFLFDLSGHWAVIQQGMNSQNRMARRYHWLSDNISTFVNEPHAGIACNQKSPSLNMVAQKSNLCQRASAELAKENPRKLIKYLKKAQTLNLPRRHEIFLSDLKTDYLQKIFLKAYQENPKDFESLLGIKGVGPKTIRALALIAELVYGTKPSYEDPVRFSFAHGGKDGIPYPVDKTIYDQSIEILAKAVNHSSLGFYQKQIALKQLL